MKPQFERTALILGNDSIQKLQQSHVIIFGLGGVGGYVCEALVRAGVGEISLVDDDDVNESNINRQIIALHSTMGKAKVDVAAERAMDINPEIKIHRHKCFYLPENSSDFDFSKYDYVVDAVDTVTAKIEIIMRSKAKNVPVIMVTAKTTELDLVKGIEDGADDYITKPYNPTIS